MQRSTQTIPEEENKERRLFNAAFHAVSGHIGRRVIVPTTKAALLELEVQRVDRIPSRRLLVALEITRVAPLRWETARAQNRNTHAGANQTWRYFGPRVSNESWLKTVAAMRFEEAYQQPTYFEDTIPLGSYRRVKGIGGGELRKGIRDRR